MNVSRGIRLEHGARELAFEAKWRGLGGGWSGWQPPLDVCRGLRRWKKTGGGRSGAAEKIFSLRGCVVPEGAHLSRSTNAKNEGAGGRGSPPAPPDPSESLGSPPKYHPPRLQELYRSLRLRCRWGADPLERGEPPCHTGEFFTRPAVARPLPATSALTRCLSSSEGVMRPSGAYGARGCLPTWVGGSTRRASLHGIDRASGPFVGLGVSALPRPAASSARRFSPIACSERSECSGLRTALSVDSFVPCRLCPDSGWGCRQERGPGALAGPRDLWNARESPHAPPN